MKLPGWWLGLPQTSTVQTAECWTQTKSEIGAKIFRAIPGTWKNRSSCLQIGSIPWVPHSSHVPCFFIKESPWSSAIFHSSTSLSIPGEHPSKVLETVIDTKMVKRHNAAETQWLIKWKYTPTEDATWEDAKRIETLYPLFDPWGQGSAQGGYWHESNQD